MEEPQIYSQLTGIFHDVFDDDSIEASEASSGENEISIAF